MTELGSGIYVLTNCLQKNNAALLNDNGEESVRGIPPIDGEPRDVEKVNITASIFYIWNDS